MKVIKLLLFSALIMVGATSYAADREVSISGVVKDSSTNEILPYTTVQIVDKSGNAVAGAITSEDGLFTLKCDAEGEVSITASFVGYENQTKSIYIGEINDNYAVGTLMLKPSATQIGEVTVKGEASKVSSGLEKQSYSLDKNIAQSGGSVLKAIQNLPGVVVNSNGTVALRGNENVLVLIDGKQSSLTGFGTSTNLDNIPSSSVERIEIINNPSAKYDSKGNAGIINIIYKENLEKGFNGEVGLAFGIGDMTSSPANIDLGGVSMQDKYSFTPKVAPNININYRSDKINYFINVDGMVRKKINSNQFTQRFDDEGNLTVNSQFSEMREQALYNIKFGADWFISDNDKLTLYGLWEDEYHADHGDVPYVRDGGKNIRLWEWTEDEDTKFMNATLLYSHQFDEAGHSLDLSYNFTGGREDELFPFSDTYFTNGAQDGATKFDGTHLFLWEYVHNFKLDYVKPLSHGRLESGINLDFHNIPIDYYVNEGNPTTGALNTNLGDWSDYQENVYAAYLNYIYESEHIEVEAGARLEQTTTDYNLNETYTYYDSKNSDDYFKVYPSARLTYKINPSNRVSAFYNYRVDRPSEFDLRPFPKYDDPEVLRTGNPTLEPQFTQHAELAYKHIWESGFFYVSGYYKWIENSIYRVALTDPNDNNLVNYVPQNFGNSTNAGFEVVAEQQLTSWWSVDGSFNWYRNTIDAHSGEVYYPEKMSYSVASSATDTWNLKANTSFELESGLNAQISFIYNAADITPVSSLSDHYSLNLGVSYPVIDDKGELYINATDLLNTDKTTETIHSEGLTMVRTDYLETQVVTIGFKYKF